jgi:hypothetical protein
VDSDIEVVVRPARDVGSRPAALQANRVQPRPTAVSNFIFFDLAFYLFNFVEGAASSLGLRGHATSSYHSGSIPSANFINPLARLLASRLQLLFLGHEREPVRIRAALIALSRLA